MHAFFACQHWKRHLTLNRLTIVHHLSHLQYPHTDHLHAEFWDPEDCIMLIWCSIHQNPSSRPNSIVDDRARDNESVFRSQPSTANIDSFIQVELAELSSLTASGCNTLPKSDQNNSKKGGRCWGGCSSKEPKAHNYTPLYNFISKIHCYRRVPKMCNEQNILYSVLVYKQLTATYFAMRILLFDLHL